MNVNEPSQAINIDFMSRGSSNDDRQRNFVVYRSLPRDHSQLMSKRTLFRGWRGSWDFDFPSGGAFEQTFSFERGRAKKLENRNVRRILLVNDPLACERHAHPCNSSPMGSGELGPLKAMNYELLPSFRVWWCELYTTLKAMNYELWPSWLSRSVMVDQAIASSMKNRNTTARNTAQRAHEDNGTATTKSTRRSFTF